jgi:hypothetical protein
VNWAIWTKKLVTNLGMVGVPVLLVELERLTNRVDVPPWVPIAAGAALVGLKALNNWLKHR